MWAHSLKTRSSQRLGLPVLGGWGEKALSKVTESHSGKASEEEMGKKGGTFKGEDGGVSSGAPECPADAGQGAQLLKGGSTSKSRRRKALCSTGEAGRLIEVLLSSLAQRHCKIWK